MSERRRTILINLAVLCASLLLSLFLAEAIFQWYFPQPTYAVKLCPWGFEHIPNISFKHATESKESLSYIQYNSQGFRGTAEYTISKPTGTLRVAILGDSYGEGAEVDYEYLHGTVLEEMLNAYLNKSDGSYRGAEVIKAGVYAYESCQELRLFEARILELKPDVVFLIYTGELSENTTFCQLQDHTLTYVNMDYTRWQYNVRYIVGYLKAKSHLLNYLHRVYRRHFGGHIHLPEQLNKTFTYEPPDSREFSKATKDIDKPVRDFMKIPEKKIRQNLPDSYEYRLLFMIFKKFDALVRNYGGTFYVVFSHKKPETFMLGHYLEKENIEYLDIFSYVNDHRTKKAHFQLDGHWNQYGHYLVARGFFELIRDKYL
ncbi:MAG: hypothetical protein PVF10_15515 [Syntrophobacterales bacterium]|jgi:hypothetical protein